jgi:hypothetical protein
MAKKSKRPTLEAKGAAEKPRSLAIIATNGIPNAQSLCLTLGAVVHDLLAGSITSSVGNAVCNATGKILKAVELQYKYGKTQPDGSKVLNLTQG